MNSRMNNSSQDHENLQPDVRALDVGYGHSKLVNTI
jgi:hypothetical protein